MYFEHVHVKTKQDNEEIGNSYGKKLVLEHVQKAKKERIKCWEEHNNDNISVRVNSFLKHRDKRCESKMSKVFKKIDSTRKLEEYFQDKHREKWKIIDIEARRGFLISLKVK